MTPTEYLEMVSKANRGYLELHKDHDEDCGPCYFARCSADVAERMLRDEDYPHDLNDCIRLYYDNLCFIMETADKK